MRAELKATLVTYLVLFVIGALAMYSLDLAKEQVFNTSSNFFVKHVVTMAVSLFLMLIVKNIPFSFYERYDKWLYAIGIVLLGVVFLFPPINGAHRWIHIGGFTLQPSEFAKIILILYLSIYAKKHKAKMSEVWTGMLLPLLYALVYVGLIVLEPNLSTAMFTFLIAAVTLYYGGTKLRYFLVAVVVIVIAVVIASTTGLLHSYQLGRLRYFFSGELAPQVEIALKTLKNSGPTGVGIGNSWLKVYVPEAESDFVLAVIGEDFGFFGIILVCVMYMFLSYSLMRLGSYIKDTALRIFTWSYATVILFHVTINLGVFAGLFPVTGIPLPFISTGGSSMMALLIGFGIILSGLFGKEENEKQENIKISKEGESM